jgi:adenylylsulfate kinase
MYKLAEKGELKDFTGISAPYEKPENPEITIYTAKETIEESHNKILDFLQNNVKFTDQVNSNILNKGYKTSVD